jgi:hypothetical protein
MIVAPGVGGSEAAALVVVRNRADELLAPWVRQRANGAVEAELRKCRSLSLARPEAGTPEQALGLFTPKGPLVDGNAHPASVIGNGTGFGKDEGAKVLHPFRKDAGGAALLRDAAQ